MTKWILAAAVMSFALPSAAGAQTTIVEPTGAYRSYQQFVDEARVVTPDTTVVVVQPTGDEECGDGTLGCFDPANGSIFVGPDAAAEGRVGETFYHELAHDWDATEMQPWQREKFDRLIGREGTPWEQEDGPFLNIESAPREWFADSYSLCARLPHIATDGYAYNLWSVFDSIGAKKLRIVCRMLGRSRF